MLSRKPTNPVLDKSHPLARGLVGAWFFDKPHGLLARDFVGANDGVLNGGATWAVDPRAGNCLRLFASGGTDYVKLLDGTLAGGKAGSSVFVWFNSSVQETVNGQTVWCERDATFGKNIYKIACGPSGSAGEVSFVYRNGNNQLTQITSSGEDCCDGNWHLVGVTVVDAGEAVLYLDGREVGRSATGTAFAVGGLNSGIEVNIGRDQYDDAAQVDGYVASATCYNRVLGAGEVVALWRTGFDFAEPQANYTEASLAVAASAPSVSISTNPNTSDTAPALFHFDASATTDATVNDPARDLDFFWVVTDDGTSEVVDMGVGCCWATVIDDAGSYTATLYCNNAEEGTESSDTVSLTVADPDTVYATTDTVCLSIAGDFTGAPTGASQQTITDGDDISTHLAANKRVLLRRGETYACTTGVTISSNEHLGAFGAVGSANDQGVYDNDPVITDTQLTPSGDNIKVEHVRLELTGAVAGTTGVKIGGTGSLSNVVLHKMQVDGYELCINVHPDLADFYSGDPCSDFAISSCRAVPDATTSTYVAYMGANRLAVCNSYFGAGCVSESTVRIPYSHKLVFCGNTLGSTANASKQTLKLHHWNYGVGATAAWVDVAEDLCITGNVINADSHDWAIGIGPTNSSADQRIDGVLFESNRVTVDTVQVAALFWCRGMKVSNNIWVGSNWDNGNPRVVEFTRRGVEPTAERGRFYHNTLWTDETGFTNVTLLYVDGTGYTGTDAICYNNVAAGSSSDGTARVYDPASTTITGSNNLDSDESPDFVDAANGNFRLPALATQIDAGTAVPVYRDYNGFARDATPDIGAYESEAGAEQVTGLTATKDGVDVDLAWLDLGVVDNYIVQRSPNGVDTWTQIATPTGTSATDLNPGTGTWYYRIASVVGATTGDWSDTALVEFGEGSVGNFGFWW